MRTMRYAILALLFALVLAACSGATEPAPSEPMADGPAPTATAMDEDMGETEPADGMVAATDESMGADEMMADDDETMDGDDAAAAEQPMDDEAMTEGGDEMAVYGADARPEWQTLPLVNARTGETFALADFSGKTVFVEPMATWCTNCRRQLGNVREAKAQLNDDDVVFVALSVETNLSSTDLAGYADAQGFDWVFAVLSEEMLQQLVDAFGRAISNPPSTPHFVIRPDGSTTELVTGIEPPAQLVASLQAAQQ